MYTITGMKVHFQRIVTSALATVAAIVMAGEADAIDFSRDVLPILSDKCFACHGPDADASDQLRLDSYEDATSDLGGYQAINPEVPGESELLLRVLSADDPMPPQDADKQLTELEKSRLVTWVKEGGQYSQHWAFVAPRRRLAQVDSADVGRRGNHFLDSYIAAKHQDAGVDFAPSADRAILARRASLVLCGLPANLDEVSDFLNDSSEDAFPRFVDRLLAKPSFGEHQARAWLDAVRYGDTHGLHLDNRRGVYPYRDWVVSAINSNLPMDQFITWQLAGDLMPNPTLEQLVATGYVRMNPTSGEGGAIEAEYQAKNNFDRTENLGSALLGMTLTCARCHTHKYDPITQTEYYQLMAFFNNTSEPALDRNKYDYGSTVKAPRNQAQWSRWVTFTKRRQDLIAEAEGFRVEGDGWNGWSDSGRQEKLEQLAEPEGLVAGTVLQQTAAKLLSDFNELQESFTTTLIAQELSSPRSTRVLRRGEYNQPIGNALQPGVPSAMGGFSQGEPLNRLGLARWLTSADHPTVTRVIVNRLWQQTFGDALVRTPEDFGVQGQYPTHPDLLDALAVEFQESGWDLKHLLRLMVTSRTFQQSSAYRKEIDDPENILWARGPSFRMDAEMIRDLGLWASGLLESQMGGEGVKPYQPKGMWRALAHPASNTKIYEADRGVKLYRRSLYLYWKRTSPHPMMTLFDAPDRETSCIRRSRTSTALQSLALLNETQRIEMARVLADRLVSMFDDEPSRLQFLFSSIGGRMPTAEEESACLEAIQQFHARYEANPDDAKVFLAVGEAKTSGTVTVAEQAAWAQISLTILASDLGLLIY